MSDGVTVDLGSYFLRCELSGDRGFILPWATGQRFVPAGPTPGGWKSCCPLPARRQTPTYMSEEDLISSIRFMFSEGNYNCDCNIAKFYADSRGEDDPNVDCGETAEWSVEKAVLIRPNGSEVVLWDREATE